MKLTHGQIVGSVVAWAGTSCFGHRKVEGERGLMGTSLYRYNAQYHAEMHGKLFHMKECGWQVAYISSLICLTSYLFTGDSSHEHAIVSFLSRALLSFSHSAISMYLPQYSATKLTCM